MLLNVSQLLAGNSSRDTLSSMLHTQHAVLLPINLLSTLLNGAALLVVYCAKNMITVMSTVLLSLTLANTLNSLLGSIIDILYFVEIIGCSGNCEMTFDPAADASPGVTVTLLRYVSDVFRTGYFWEILLSAVHHWLLMTSPLRSEVISRRRSILIVKVLMWIACLLGNLPTLVVGLSLDSDNMFFVLRAYAIPVVHTIHTSLVLLFYYKLAGIAIYHIAEVAKVEKLETRFHPRQASLKRYKSQNRKNANVIQLIVFFFGPFLATMSPSIYFRAFRPHLTPTLLTVRTLLILDVLPHLNFLLNILILSVAYKPFNRILREHFRAASDFLCTRCLFCNSTCWPCTFCESYKTRSVNGSQSLRSSSTSNGFNPSFSIRSRSEDFNRALGVQTREDIRNDESQSIRPNAFTTTPT